MRILKKLKRNFDSVILVGVGFFSVFLSLAPVVLGIKIIDKLGEITLFSIGLLCISIAIERFFKLEGVEESLNQLKEKIETIASAEVIEGEKRVFEVAEELIKDAKRFIRATSFGKEEHTPDDYLRAVAKKLKESKEQGNPVEYRVVMSFEKRSKRSKIFEEEGVSHLFRRGYVNATWGLDVLIIDNEHLLIAFPELSAEESLQRGILFKNKPKLVNGIREWYDGYLWKYAEKE